MGRAPCCDKANVKRGPWSPEEDAALRSYLEIHGTAGNWIALPKKAGLRRCGKSCRLRWLNYLRPNIKHGGFTKEEDDIIIRLYSGIGSRWSIIASQLPGRTDNDVKNYWNTKLKKRLLAGGTSLLNPKSNGIVTTNGSSSASSIAMESGFLPAQDYNYKGFLPALEARAEPGMFSTLPSNVHYGPSLKAQGRPSPEFGSIIDFRGNVNSSASHESSSVNSSGNSPYSLGIVDSNWSASASCGEGAVGECCGTTRNFGLGLSWDALINELLFDEEASEISPNAFAEAEPQVLDQNSMHLHY